MSIMFINFENVSFSSMLFRIWQWMQTQTFGDHQCQSTTHSGCCTAYRRQLHDMECASRTTSTSWVSKPLARFKNNATSGVNHLRVDTNLEACSVSSWHVTVLHPVRYSTYLAKCIHLIQWYNSSTYLHRNMLHSIGQMIERQSSWSIGDCKLKSYLQCCKRFWIWIRWQENIVLR